jgi:DNA-binding transcriptional LysR family regulator
MDTSKFDLNLLLVFEAISREQNVSRAARRLGLSQPAVSGALARLRSIVGDPLFVRTSHGVQPTRRAQQLSEPVETALSIIRSSLRQNSEFQPAQSEITFKLLMTDVGQAIYLNKLLAHVRLIAPGIRFRVLQLSESNYIAKLESGGLDLAVGALQTVSENIRCRSLFVERFVCLLSKQHPTIHDTLSLEQYLEAEHIVESNMDYAYGKIAHQLSDIGTELKIALRVPQLLPVFFTLGQSDLLATVPSRLADACCQLGGTKQLPLPFELPGLSINLYWHERFHHDPANRWLRKVFIELFGKKSERAKSEPEAESQAMELQVDPIRACAL